MMLAFEVSFAESRTGTLPNRIPQFQCLPPLRMDWRGSLTLPLLGGNPHDFAFRWAAFPSAACGSPPALSCGARRGPAANLFPFVLVCLPGGMDRVGNLHGPFSVP